MNHTRSNMAPYKRIIQPKNFTSNIRATKHNTIGITIAMIILYSFPNAMQKKFLNLLCQTIILLLLNIMTIAKYIIIESHDQKVRNKNIHVSNQRTYNN